MRRKYVGALARLITQSRQLTHLNLTSTFIGLQTEPQTAAAASKDKEERKLPGNDNPASKEEQGEKPAPDSSCSLTVLFKAVYHSKSLQSVHYSGNSLNQSSLEDIKKILGVIEGNGYLTGGTATNQDQLDRFFEETNKTVDMKQVHALIKKQHTVNTQ